MPIRLLNVQTLKLETFYDAPPSYAILSHTWEKEEMTFEDMNGEIDWATKVQTHAGFRKVGNCCARAMIDGYEYAWVDTCCIDKASSAELSEAINSMIRWYEDAAICYAYLVDVPKSTNHRDPESLFRRSRWFTRGWTMQELVAPGRRYDFFAEDWSLIGSKQAMHHIISEITGIPSSILRGDQHYLSASVAQRMAWASKRRTTVPEDVAYCLMGLFAVNMPLLYGEGRYSAFKRLQYEIMAESNDETIFAWEGKPTGSMIAQGPECFQKSGRMMPRLYKQDPNRPPYSMTNKGLRIEPMLFTLNPRDYETQTSPRMLPTQVIDGNSSWECLLLPLNCINELTNQQVVIQLFADRTGTNCMRLSQVCYVLNYDFQKKFRRVIYVKHPKEKEAQQQPLGQWLANGSMLILSPALSTNGRLIMSEGERAQIERLEVERLKGPRSVQLSIE